MSCLQDLLKTGIDCSASDIHVMVGSPPLLRIHTILQETDYPVVTAEMAETMVREMLPPWPSSTLKVTVSTLVSSVARYASAEAATL